MVLKREVNGEGTVETVIGNSGWERGVLYVYIGKEELQIHLISELRPK